MALTLYRIHFSSPLKKLNRYIFREHLLPFTGAVMVISLIFLINFLLRSMDRLLGKNLGAKVLFEFVALNMAWILAMAIPMGVLISVLMVYGRLSEDNEITALRAGGISFSSIIRPSLLFAFLVGAGTVYFNNFILPDANHNARLLRGDIYRKNPDLNLDAGYFINDIPGYTLFITDKEGSLLLDLLIFHTRDNGRRISIWAKEGELKVVGNKVLLNLRSGQIHEYPAKSDEDYRILDFARHQIVIPVENMVLERRDTARRGDREMDIPTMLSEVSHYKTRQRGLMLQSLTILRMEPADSLNFSYVNFISELNSAIASLENDSLKNDNLTRQERGALQRQITQLKTSRNRIESNLRIYGSYQKQINRYLVEVHKKVAMPAACIIFVMVGAPLGMLARKGGMTMASSISLFFFIIYWAFMMAGERLSDRNLMIPWVSMWTPNIIFGIVGIFLIWYAIHERISLQLPAFLKRKKTRKES
ncbi:MAG TPA: YjgP/YjgQ family permease [Candidatus Marinimicrobia bacterium]|nr:YjgP/YjgQ family permease [Candidatus Neomarinimicrobiota bacterium]